MSGSRRKGEKSKDDTWGEKELSKYIAGSGSGKGAKDASSKKKVTVDAYGSYGSPKSQAKRKSGTSSSSSTKQSASSTKKESTSTPSHASGVRQDTKSGKERRAGVGDKPRERSSEKTRTSQGTSGRSGEKGEPTTKRPSRDSRETQDPKSRRREKDEPSRALETKPERSRTKDSHGRSEGRSHRQSTERDKERRKDNGRDSRTNEKGKSERHKDQSHRRDKEGVRHRSSDSRDRSKEKKREINVSEDPPPVPAEEDDIESNGQEASGHNPEGNPPQQMVEVTEESGDVYQYEDEEFEDYEYEDDFDEVPEEEEEVAFSESESEGSSSTPDERHGDQLTTKSKVQSQNDNQRQVDLFAIMQAIDAENMAVETSSQSNIVEPSFDNVEGTVVVKFAPKESDSEEGSTHDSGGTKVMRKGGIESLKSPSRKFVDFSYAQKNEASLKVAKKTRKRAQELLSMIELDIVSHDMFDLPPLSEYELYVKKFGADDTRQVSVQTGEDNQDSEAQTEPITTEERWVQWPPEDLRGWGKGGEPCDDEDEEAAAFLSHSGMEGEGALKLISFLKKAGHVCSVLLEENLAAVGQSTFQSTQSQFPFCSTTHRIQAVPPFLSGRYVRWVDFSATQDNLFLSAYTLPPSSSKTADSGIRGKGLVCLWNIRDPLQPQMVLSCESSPTCCCFSPQKASLAFAGNEDGSVVVWDLREPLSMHKQSMPTPLSPRGRDSDSIARVPTFSTAGVSHLDNHRAPIVSITPISTSSSPSNDSAGGSSSHGDDGVDSLVVSSGLSFQLATLDKSGHLNIWVVVEVMTPDPYGSEADLGLVPGGRVKVVKSTSIDIASQPARRATERSLQGLSSVQVFCMQFHPEDTSHLYVGADTGRVCHVTRYGRRPVPRYHVTPLDNDDAVCDVLSLSFSHRQPNHFLAGCSDGSLKLYHTKTAKPLLMWNTFASYGAAVVHVQWVETCPGLFLVQDSFNTIYMWDLLQNDSEPVYKETQKPRVTCCHLHCQSHTHKSSSPPILILAHEDNSIAVHQFRELAQDIDEREKTFEEYLTNLA